MKYYKPNGEPHIFNPKDDATGRKNSWEEDGYTVIRTHARTAPGCHGNCGVLLYVKDGRVDHVEGDTENPFNQGRLCPRCLAMTEMMYHKDRITKPLRRTGKRGENKWEEISWDEAYDEIEKNLRKIINEYGPEAIWILMGTGRDINGYLPRLGYVLNTPNLSSMISGNSCYIPRIYMCNQKMGTFVVGDYSQFFPDRYDHKGFEIPEYILIWGNNPVFSNSDGLLGHWIVEMMKRGSKLITIDPRLTWLAAKSDVFLQIKPGTDAALALAIGNVICTKELFDKDFIKEWTNGFEEYRRRTEEYSPEKVADICGIEKELIIEAAEKIGRAKSVALQWGASVDQNIEPIYTGATLLDIIALTGNIEKPGTMVSASPAFGVRQTWQAGWGAEMLSPEQKNKKINKKFPYATIVGSTLPDSVCEAAINGEPYPIKAAWIQTTNPLANTAQDPKRALEALENLDFNVVVDLFMTPTAAKVADIFLPAACYAERDGLCGHQPYFLGAISKAVEPLGECKSDHQIIYEISSRFRPEDNPWKNEVEMYDSILGPLNISYDDMKKRTWAYPDYEYNKHEKGLLRPDKKPGFNTASGKYEFLNPALKQAGLDPLPAYYPPPYSPEMAPERAKEYPLILITGARRPEYFLSEHKQSKTLRRLHPDPVVTINTITAEREGIKDGDWVIVENERGKARMRAEVSMAIREDVVNADCGFWYPERDYSDGTCFGVFESNINLLITMKTGRTGMGATFKSELCRIRKE